MTAVKMRSSLRMDATSATFPDLPRWGKQMLKARLLKFPVKLRLEMRLNRLRQTVD